MSTQPTRRGLRQRKRVLDLDLNDVPRGDNLVQVGSSSQVELQETTSGQQQFQPPAAIDVEAIDDDVIESSARAFAEAKNKARRNGGRIIVDIDAEENSAVGNTYPDKRRRLTQHQNTLEQSEDVIKAAPQPEPTFNCPICMAPFSEPMSTKCGHIFCKACIKTAIKVQAKCPTCRKKISTRELIRIFLPSTR